eukprot:Tbor_TRINITY_DN714_c0_g1::TRINITY_DN714_c0_g1_i1::g.3385::m.3385/K07390/grxD, GLRX5; monothiol glutaredoxin
MLCKIRLCQETLRCCTRAQGLVRRGAGYTTRPAPACPLSFLPQPTNTRLCSTSSKPIEPSSKNTPDVPSLDADGSHPDFKPRISAMNEVTQDEIDTITSDIKETIASEDVVLFMKGVPEAPICGFSKRLVDVLEELEVEYTSFDCLAHPVVRTCVKEISDWPTVPQLFIKGEFAGGVDILLEMAGDGQLEAIFKRHGIPFKKTR